jgi:hypothetical protein
MVFRMIGMQKRVFTNLYIGFVYCSWVVAVSQIVEVGTVSAIPSAAAETTRKPREGKKVCQT